MTINWLIQCENALFEVLITVVVFHRSDDVNCSPINSSNIVLSNKIFPICCISRFILNFFSIGTWNNFIRLKLNLYFILYSLHKIIIKNGNNFSDNQLITKFRIILTSAKKDARAASSFAITKFHRLCACEISLSKHYLNSVSPLSYHP